MTAVKLGEKSGRMPHSFIFVSSSAEKAKKLLKLFVSLEPEWCGDFCSDDNFWQLTFPFSYISCHYSQELKAQAQKSALHELRLMLCQYYQKAHMNALSFTLSNGLE